MKKSSNYHLCVTETQILVSTNNSRNQEPQRWCEGLDNVRKLTFSDKGAFQCTITGYAGKRTD